MIEYNDVLKSVLVDVEHACMLLNQNGIYNLDMSLNDIHSIVEELRVTLLQRNKSYGEFSTVAFEGTSIRRIYDMEAANDVRKDNILPSKYNDLNTCVSETRYMLSLKLSRILTSNSKYSDHWLDVAGYIVCLLIEVKRSTIIKPAASILPKSINMLHSAVYVDRLINRMSKDDYTPTTAESYSNLIVCAIVSLIMTRS